ncbi:flagellar biosynthesis protein FlhB [Dongshaea marina]|uniref:flagellar biosynthesis protein FlhB n=1 Tax=Dongshaea marina TaxID=2047966 RepID=UPI000D3E2728|nr:flagellar biosynthesis protein FlhB [Dongshaea marina]
MAESQDSSQEKNQAPTPDKLRKAREQGDILRSRELVSALMMTGTALGLKLLAPMMSEHLLRLFRENLSFDHTSLFDPRLLLHHLQQALIDCLVLSCPILLLLLLLGIGGNLLLGGLNFSSSSLAPKFSKMNPASGFKRMFSRKSAVELVKSTLKVSFIGLALYLMLQGSLPQILRLGQLPLPQALLQFNQLLWHGLLYMSLTLVVIAVLEIPYQWWEHQQKLRMTQQEVKDEHKENEGKPEVKSRIRRQQREISQRRMLQAVGEANAVLINPSHYAVALRYQPEQDPAPILIAKGMDHMAAQIREAARRHQTPILSIPDLTRSIYYTTKLDRAIPVELYQAVALILVYIQRLSGDQARPPLPSYSIPNHLQY